jgi:phosphopantetheinyl transferase
MHKAIDRVTTGLAPGLYPYTQHSAFMLTARAQGVSSGQRPGNGHSADAAVRIDVALMAELPSAADRQGLRLAQSAGVRALLRRALPAGQQLHIQKNQAGQPRLVGDAMPHISLAHSKAWLACALAPAHPVGVDIEHLRPRDWHTLAPQTFHPVEAQWVLAATGAERDIRGLTAWCRREALAKALGLGLDAPWPWDRVAFDPAGRLIANPPQLGDAAAWTSFSTVVAGQAVLATVWRRADRAANDVVAA